MMDSIPLPLTAVTAPGNGDYASLFSVKKQFSPADDDLNHLARWMTAQTIKPQGIPAGYTYLSQFIDHDIALDSAARISPWTPINPATIQNLRTPFLDLDTLYGKTQPATGEIGRNDLLATASLLKIGDTVTDLGKLPAFRNDLPRQPKSPKALIADSRNDENLAVAQTHVAFIKFHNAVAESLGGADTAARFDEAREIVIRHYQWIVLHDFLPRVVKQDVLDDVLQYGAKFFRARAANQIFMPLEFSAGAYRFGHSLVRDDYEWNRFHDSQSGFLAASLAALREQTGDGKMRGINNLTSDWVINWKRFYDINNSSQTETGFNRAQKIDTHIAQSLGMLNSSAMGFDREYSLPALDLYRAKALGLPSGQAVAAELQKFIPLGILPPEEIAALLPDNGWRPKFPDSAPRDLTTIFAEETPLWFYFLAEAEIETGGATLGEAGSRIVCEVFYQLLKFSPFSILQNGWQPGREIPVVNNRFGMSELLLFVAKQNPDYDELDPVNLIV